MKALFCRKNLSKITLIVILLFITPLISCLGKTNTNTFEKNLEKLDFKPLDKTSSTQHSIDQYGNTWLKVSIPKKLLNRPLIFQVLSTHVDQYCIYTQRDNKWIRVPPNTDLNGGNITTQFQENHFITNTSTIYIKSKTPYVNNGNFILVERNDFRAIGISNMMKIGAFYGLFLMSIMMNFGLYLIFKERVTLFYSLFITSIISIVLLEDGFVYFLSSGIYDQLYILTCLIPITCLVFPLFMYSFLDVKILSSKVKYLYICLVLLFIILAGLYVITRDLFYFITLVTTSISTVLATVTLALVYYKRDLSISLVSFSFSIVAIAAIGYYFSIYFGNNTLSFLDLNTMRALIGLCFVTTNYALLIKVKNLKTEHESFRTELEHLKANQAKIVYEDVKLQETIHSSQKNTTEHTSASIITTIPSEDPITLKDLLRDKYLCTDREIDVIFGIWNGLSNQEIAEKLSISLSTTKHHVSNAYVKLDVKSRSQTLILKDTLLAEKL